MTDVALSGTWLEAFPGAAAGFLAMEGVANPPRHDALDERVREVEAELRARFGAATRTDLAALPVLAAYASHYRRFDKTYHVQLQLESVVLKGKPLRSEGAVVTAMFAAEIRNLLLTAGHDLDAIAGPSITADAARAGERYVAFGGRPVETKAGDMLMRDGSGIVSSVLYGPDDRTRLTADTRRAIFCVYAPAGIGAGAVGRHLEDIASNVRLVSPGASVVLMDVLTGAHPRAG